MYRDFCSLDVHTPRGVIYFYEKNEKSIGELELKEYFDILVAYTEALFNCEEYEKHILMSEVVLETSIFHNVVYHRKEDIFQKMLFRKASSYYLLRDYAKSSQILRQLCRINSSETGYSTFLKKSDRLANSNHMQTIRAFTIFCFLLGSVATLIEVLVVRNFYMEYQNYLEWFRISLFAMGVLGILYRFFDNYQSQAIKWEDLKQSDSPVTIPDNF
ncbi:MAG: hypothetical protein ACOYOA_05755 [Saprospiraceae bacterium]